MLQYTTSINITHTDSTVINSLVIITSLFTSIVSIHLKECLTSVQTCLLFLKRHVDGRVRVLQYMYNNYVKAQWAWLLYQTWRTIMRRVL